MGHVRACDVCQGNVLSPARRYGEPYALGLRGGELKCRVYKWNLCHNCRSRKLLLPVYTENIQLTHIGRAGVNK